MSQYVYFDELPVKSEFWLNGNKWVKRSSRTAYLPDYDRWFYFGKKELVVVNKHSRIDWS